MKNYAYDISIIVPVYNTEKYLKKCIESLINQKYNQKKLQIILINDGSIDNSLKICQAYKNKYSNIVLINKKNSGVSAARNDGLRIAKGKYIMFVDSDDYISLNSCKYLYRFFEKNYYDIDLVQYACYNIRKNRIKKHYRHRKYLKKEGIYDLIKNPNLIETSIRVMIKNGLNMYFDENSIFAEDELFDTEIIMKRKKMGYVPRAKYYYNIHSNNATNTTVYKKNVLVDTYNYYSKLLNTYNNDPYIQELFINTLRWRTQEKKLLTATDNKKIIQLLKKNINKIDVERIKANKEISNINKAFIMKIGDAKIDAKITDNACHLMINNKEFIKERIIPIRIYKFKIVKNKLLICGEIYSPIFEWTKPKLYATNDKDIVEIELKKSHYLSYSKEYNVKMYSFEYEINISKLHNLQFTIEVNNTIFKTAFSKDGIHEKYVYDGCYYILNKDNIMASKNAFFKVIRYFKNMIKSLKYPEHIFWRILYLFYNKKKKILLCYDEINIKSFAQQYDKVFYIRDKNPDNLNNVVIYGSNRHKQLFLKSKAIIVKQNDELKYNPFNNINVINDLVTYDIICNYDNDKSELSNIENNICDYILINNEGQENEIIDYLYYSKDDIIYL